MMLPFPISKNLQYLFFFVSLVWLLLNSGCTGEGVPKTCVSDDICGLGRICVVQRCVEGCRRQADCPEGEVCFENRCGKQICKPGQQIACYDGSNHTKGSGICREGVKFCLRDGTEWSACVQQLLPQQEVCDRADNDCDGQIDEGLSCECTPGSRRSCYHGAPETLQKGTCQAGIQYCENDHRWGQCHGQKLPETESCDGKDNNCNGLIDEWIVCDCQPGQTRECYSGLKGTDGVGQCKKGQQSCTQENRWGICVGEVTPQMEENESCNGKDDDCDGVIDNRSGSSEPLKDFCYEGPTDTLRAGSPCREGVKTCQNGQWGACIGQQLPTKEICNQIDDDCNGQIDEGCQTQCNQGATRSCYPESNKGCSLVNNVYTCQGECRAGIQICQQGQWSVCLSPRLPQPEECNQKDDDCDGIVDNDCNKYCTNGETRSCYDVQQKGCNASPDGSYLCSGECKTGVQICQKNVWGTCLFAVVPQKELCDGKDNDCDGAIDEDFPLLQQPCTVGKGICAQTDRYVCNPQGTQVMCPAQAKLPGIEICDGKDNDCDGVIDNDCICVPTCPAGTECKQGQCMPIVMEPLPEPQTEALPEPPQEIFTTEGIPDISQAPDVPGDSGPEATPEPEIAPEPEITPEPEIGPLPEGYVCYPGQTLSCYTGPSVTQQKGACRDGTQTCQNNGQWGSCVGQTLPTKEICDGLDNDCDGQVDELPELQGPLCDQNGNVCTQGSSCQQKPGVCQGATAQCLGILGWAKTCSAADYQRHSASYQVVEDRCDNLDNDCDGQIDENCPWVVTPEPSNITQSPGKVVVVDSQQNLYVAGHFVGTLVLGNTTLQSSGGASMFVTKINPSGQLVWSLKFAATGNIYPTSIVVNSKNNLFVGGYFYHQVQFGSTTLQAFSSSVSNQSSDGFVVQISSSGQVLSSLSFGGVGDDKVKTIAFDGQDNLYVNGEFRSVMSIGNYILRAIDGSLFATKIDSSGNILWAVSFGASGTANVPAPMDVSSRGSVFVSGRFLFVGTFGSLTLNNSTGGRDVMFVAKLDGATGSFLNVVRVATATTGDEHIHGLVVDKTSEDIYLTGAYHPGTVFGSFSLVSPHSGGSLFVAKLAANGNFVWVNGYREPTGRSIGRSILLDKSGDPVVTGSFDNAIVFDPQQKINLISQGGTDAFVAKFSAQTGQARWSTSGGGTSRDDGWGIGIDSFGNFYIAGGHGNSAVLSAKKMPSGTQDYSDRFYVWQILRP